MECMVYYVCEFAAMAVKIWLILQLFACLHDPKMELRTEHIVWGDGNYYIIRFKYL